MDEDDQEVQNHIRLISSIHRQRISEWHRREV